jgi:hypothetical protein
MFLERWDGEVWGAEGLLLRLHIPVDGTVAGNGAGDGVGAVGGEFDSEVEEFVDPPLILGRGADEVLGGVEGAVVELGEVGRVRVSFFVSGSVQSRHLSVGSATKGGRE